MKTNRGSLGVKHSALGVDGGTDDTDFIAGGNDFETAALQRAHLDHFVDEAVEQTDVDEFGVGAGDVELARALHVDAGSGGRGQRAVAQGEKFGATGVAVGGVSENLFGLQIQKAHPHGAVPEDAFQVTAAAAAAEIFFGVQRHYGVAAFPNAFGPRITAEADAVAEGPHANEFMEFVARGRYARGHGVGVVENANRHRRVTRKGSGRQRRLEMEAFHLLEIGGVLHHAVADDPRKTQADRVDLFSFGDAFDLLLDAISDAVRGHPGEDIQRPFLRIHAKRADDLVVFYEPHRDVFHHQYADCPAHSLPQFVQAVEGGGFVAFGERRIIENGIGEILDGAFERKDCLTDMDKFASAFSDDVHAEKLF